MQWIARMLKWHRTESLWPDEIVVSGSICTCCCRNAVLRPRKCLRIFPGYQTRYTCLTLDPLLLSGMHTAVLLFTSLLDQVVSDSVERIRRMGACRNFARAQSIPSPHIICCVSVPFSFLLLTSLPSISFPSFLSPPLFSTLPPLHATRGLEERRKLPQWVQDIFWAHNIDMVAMTLVVFFCAPKCCICSQSSPPQGSSGPICPLVKSLFPLPAGAHAVKPGNQVSGAPRRVAAAQELHSFNFLDAQV